MNEAIKDHIPLKQKRVKKLKQPAWMNDDIINAIKKRDLHELNRARKSNTPADWENYKRTRCFVTKLIKKSKRVYFQETIENNKGNPKGIWKALKSLTKTQKSNKIAELKCENNTMETDPLKMAEMLNDYFVNIIKQIGDDSFSTDLFDGKKLDEFISSRVDNFITQFNIPPITLEEVTDLINNLPSSKATGPDSISVKILKLVAPVFCHPLTKLLNLSIADGTFPSKWKIARVTPLFKTGSRDLRNNYRPISVLSILSKILEKHVAKNLMSYLVKNGLLYKLQSAFRKGYSTESALIKLTDQILFNMDNDEVTAMIFVDFRKAFDVVDHQLLLTKLKLYRVSDSALSWFTSYVTNRSQFVTIERQRSDCLPIKQGVPQGSVLGPVLFLLFVNDLPLHLTRTSTDIFADDTTLSASAHWTDIPTVVQDINNDLEKISEWSTRNRMIINTDKTKSLLVTGKRLEKKILESDNENLALAVKLGNTQIDQVSCQKLLGVTLDKSLTYEAHIDHLCKQLSKRLGLFKHISPYLKKRQRELYYNAVIKPTLMYGSVVWDCCSAECFQKVLRLQKRAARIILDSERTTPSIYLFNTLNWLPFTKQSMIKRTIVAFKRVNTFYYTPDYLDSLLVRNSDIHERNTRYSNFNMLCPKFKRKTEGGRTFAVRTVTDWNKINLNMRKTRTVSNFKKNLYSQLLNEQKAASNIER